MELVWFNLQRAELLRNTRAWLERSGVNRLEFDASFPGYDPAWEVGSPSERSFDLDVETPVISSLTGLMFLDP